MFSTHVVLVIAVDSILGNTLCLMFGFAVFAKYMLDWLLRILLNIIVVD